MRVKNSFGAFFVLGVILVIMSVGGCATFSNSTGNLLPSGESSTIMPWKDYAQAESAFYRIVPGKTTLKDLDEIGFSSMAANATVLDPLTIKNLFLGPNSGAKMEQYPEVIQAYLNDFEHCKGLQFHYEVLKTKGQGSLFLRTFDFKAKDSITGWNFDAWIFIRKDLVVYKLWKGTPNINRTQQRNNPLGPMGPILKNAPGLAIGSIL